MKRIMMITLLVLMVGSVTAFAGGDWRGFYQTNQYKVIATIPTNPPKVGENPISVSIKDVAGNTVTDAKVYINYDMEGMRHNAKTVLQAGAYKGKLDFSMPGEWIIDVRTTVSGRTFSSSFKVNVAS